MRNTRFSAFLFLIITAFVVDAQTPEPNLRPTVASGNDGVADRSATSSGETAFTEWTRSHAIALKTVEAGHGFDDMEKLGKTVGNARIVALGEATHGTREFFQLKHRIIEFLATNKGFTIFSIEANMPEAYRLNDYVLHGIGDPRELIKGMYFWTWNTQEVLAMVEWMRQFNESGRGHLEFTGFDMQFPSVPAEIVRKFVAVNDSEYSVQLEQILQNVSGIAEDTARDLQTRNADFRQTLRALTVEQRCKEIVNHLEMNRDFYLSQGSSDSAIDWAVQNARLLLEYVQLKAGEKTRDESMAENVRWIADHNTGSKIILWAHNLHVTRGVNLDYRPMGSFLSKWFGAQYLNFGFAFDRGSFRAVDLNKQLHEFSVGEAPEGSLDCALAKTGIPVLVLDLRQLPSQGAVADWAKQPHLTRSIGAVYSDQSGRNYFIDMKAQDWYETLVFIDETTAARGNASLK